METTAYGWSWRAWLTRLSLVFVGFLAGSLLSLYNDEVFLSRDWLTSVVQLVPIGNVTSFPVATVAMQPRCSQETRRQAIHDLCGESNHSNAAVKVKKLKLVVDDYHHSLYCPIPKVACSSFKLLLAQASPLFVPKSHIPVHSGGYLSSVGLPPLNSFTENEAKRRLEEYFKFVVVRHPFDRLASVHAEKFAGTNVVYIKGFCDLFKEKFQFRDCIRERLTFEQFVELVVTEPTFKNYHWDTMTSFCDPCTIAFDHIVRLETIDTDIGTILERHVAANGSQITLSSRNRSRTVSDKMASLREAYKNIPAKYIDALYKKYEHDFKLFGYHWANSSQAECYYSNGESRCC